jgi:hypothetical protein
MSITDTDKPKRKTHTSSAVKNRYAKKVYKNITVALKKDLVAAWEIAIASDGLTRAEWVRTRINQYLEEKMENP